MLALTASLTLALSISGCSVLGSSKAEKQVATVETTMAKAEGVSVPFNGWELTLGTPEVIWSDYAESDLLVLPVHATNNTGTEATLEDVSNFLAFPDTVAKGTTTGYLATCVRDATTTPAKEDVSSAANASTSDAIEARGEDGYVHPYHDLSAVLEPVKAGDAVDITYVWKLTGNYGDVRFELRGYVPSADDADIMLEGVVATDEYKLYKAEKDAEKAAASNAGTAEIRGATVQAPEGWHLANTKTSSTEVVQDADASVKEPPTARVQFITTTLGAQEQAVRSATQHGASEESVGSAEVGGVTWYVYELGSNRVKAFAQCSNGIINLDGSNIGWEDAEAILNQVTLH